MTENERLKLLAKAEAIYDFMSDLHSEICKLTDKKDMLRDEACYICVRLIKLRQRLGGFDNDGE